ncbi:hypothetical protein [Gottfriedia solisilvae]|uniref:Uncharacterized protein n=1 Tax=Gottfriedia solisilvae TaxID=1516104 RepID=A0A8J3AD50_9BACI|nr:hypothetical protein [Gottfriedia solisilvae]GGI11852.1 hypothetical protein GCM10007380_09920 [Gottfriedia solisilvae]
MHFIKRINPLLVLTVCLFVMNGCSKKPEISNEKVTTKVTNGDFVITVKTPKEVEVGKKIELESSIEYIGTKKTYLIHRSNGKDFNYSITKKHRQNIDEIIYPIHGNDQNVKRGDVISEKEVITKNKKGTYEIIVDVNFASSNKVYSRKKEDLKPIKVKIEGLQLKIK